MKVGNEIQHESGKWSFADEETVKRFDEHIKQSIPLYDMAHDLVVSLVNHFIQEDGQILEIGTSTGALAYKIATRYESNNVKVREDRHSRKHDNIRAEI